MERLSHLSITHIACMTLCMFLSSWQCCDEHVFIFLVVLWCACSYLLGSVVMSEWVHAVKVRDISKGKRIAILGKYLMGSVFMQYLSFFCFGKYCNFVRYVDIYVLFSSSVKTDTLGCDIYLCLKHLASVIALQCSIINFFILV